MLRWLPSLKFLEVAGRVADLKMDLIQKLERQRQTLLAYRNNQIFLKHFRVALRNRAILSRFVGDERKNGPIPP